MSLVSDVILQDAAMADDERLKAIAKRWEAYYGNSAKPLTVKPGQVDDNLRLNFVGTVVNEGVGFLFGQDIDFVAGKQGQPQGEDGQNTEDKAADDWLENCWATNRGMTLLTKLAINGGVAGHAFLRVIEAKSLENPGPFPRLVLVDPATVTAITDPHDFESVLQWQIRWHGMDPSTNQPVAYRKIFTQDATKQSWEIMDQESPANTRQWATTFTGTWAHSWSPVFHCQNLPAPNVFYGTADLEDDVLEAARGINFTASNIGRILRFHAHPRTWGNGFTAKSLETAPDATLILPSKEATLQNLEMQSDLSSSLAYYDKLTEAFFAVSRTPAIAMGHLDDLGQLSGLALQVMYGPLLRKNGLKRRLYGDMLCDLSARMLELGGFGEGRSVSITWPDPLPADPLAQRQTALIDEQLGVSKATLIEKLGYDAKTEMDRKADEQQDLGTQLLTGFDRGTNNAASNAASPKKSEGQNE